ncbi:MAG: hypothetical protein RL112_679 [Planctomycetota bacterium]
MALRSLFSLGALAGLATFGHAQGGVVVFQGPAGGAGRVVVLDETTGVASPVAPAFQAIELLPIEAAQRATLTEWLPQSPRLGRNLGTATHIILPLGRGAVYHHRRVAEDGVRYGYFLVRASGAVSLLHEQPALVGGGDPYFSKLAVSPDGAHVLAATRQAAGGDLYEIGLDGAVENRTALAPPLRIGSDSLHLGTTFGAVATGRGFVRFARASGAQVSLVPYAPGEGQPLHFNALAASLDGAHCVGIAGASAQQAWPYVFGATGPAHRAASQPSTFTGAGFQPESASGPHLAVSNDGTQVVWRSVVPTAFATSGEAMLAPQGQSAPTQQVSGDAYVIDTLDEVGLFGFRIDGTLLVAIGEATPIGEVSLQKADLYAVTQGPSGPQFQNLSASSGDTNVPFLGVPDWDIAGAHLLPDGSGWMVQQMGATPSIEHLSFAGVRTPLLSQLRRIQWLSHDGAGILAIVQLDTNQRPVQAWALPSGPAPAAQLLASWDNTSTAGAPATREGSSSFALQEQGNWRLMRREPSSPLQAATPNIGAITSPLQRTSLGGTAFSSGDGATTGRLWIWRAGAAAPEALGDLAGPLQVLPTNS